MSLRTRLTSAFLATVLAPALIGAVFAAGYVASAAQERAADRLTVASGAVRTSFAALCGQLRAVAEAVADAPEADRAGVAQRYVARGLVSGVHVESDAETGFSGLTTVDAPPPPWALCAPGTSEEIGPATFEGIAARVDLVDAQGDQVGTVWAAQSVDPAALQRLADSAGVRVTLLSGDGVVPAVSTAGGPGDFARRLGTADGIPLPLVLSVPEPSMAGRYLTLIAVVLLTAGLAVVVAWWLARTTTAPLDRLARAADQVADGDLRVRVPVESADEMGRLGSAFNRMTAELESYVEALTASRDQLRGQLGVLGDTLSSTHDLHRILQVILQTARHAAGARAGAVLLVDPATGLLTAQCAEGVDGSVLRVPIGEGLLGSVAATGVPVRGRTDRDRPVLLPMEPASRSYVIVPFTLGGLLPAEPAPGTASARGLWPAGLPAAQGVLALYDRLGRDEFDDGDLDTLRTFAGQASVAVDNVRVHEEAQRLSVTDSLTGLLNYRSMLDCLRREVERAHRFGRRLCVLAMDLDRFKEINDSFGHAAGDIVLTEFARRVRGEIREVDLAFRHGGEEFVVLLPETDLAGGQAVAERLCAALRTAPVLLPRGRVEVTVSIGIAVYPEHGESGSAVVQAADDALYAAKAAGRDRYRTAGDAIPDVARPAMSAALGACAPVGELTARGASGGTQTPRQGNGR